MTLLAALSSPEHAATLIELLKKAEIPCETRAATDEAGLDVSEVHVDDDRFDAACAVAEEWEAALQAAEAARTQRRCASCGSANVDYVTGVDSQKSLTQISALIRCTDCGHVTGR